ncbi:hypothetical protein V6N12_022833 [Hibiscus sabdariffa]|uniref:Uncharacterized protein n=1 Tax=Hibiscus sabdariffa TaxID=183260 RepID=A0ABR2FWN7_9ROSI
MRTKFTKLALSALTQLPKKRKRKGSNQNCLPYLIPKLLKGKRNAVLDDALKSASSKLTNFDSALIARNLHFPLFGNHCKERG